MIDNLARHKNELLDSLHAESLEAVLKPGAGDDDQSAGSLVFRHRDGSVLSASELRLLGSINEDDVASHRSYWARRNR
jgi:hypothetical protein